jgi:hypothetical protein
MNGLVIAGVLTLCMLQLGWASAVFVSLARPARAPPWLVQIPSTVRCASLFVLSLASGTVLHWAGL